jgi:alkanesulfonate monooxygenase SsuD/methylene tetrahydromethanopterin reductase-like flavin-dependent oxidoreductase (luciferase family)
MDEYIDAMRTLWRDDEASFEGSYVRFDRMECRPWPVRRAIPLFVGGASEAALRRAARTGDGYFPFLFPGQEPVEVLPRLLDRFRHLAESYGRDPASLEITSGGARTVDEAAWYADQGVHRLTIAVRSRTVEEMRDELARFSDEVIAKTRDL